MLLAPTELAVLFELLASKFMLIPCKNIGQQAVFSLDRLGAISTPPGLFRNQIYGIEKIIYFNFSVLDLTYFL